MRRKQRFPRLNVSSAEKITAQILHRVYNTLAIRRNPDLGWRVGFDISKTRRGKYADRSFLLLAAILCQKKIEPTVYLKTMSNYGKLGSAEYLPHPSFLASEKALDIFDWLWKKEKRHHVDEDGWKEHGLGSNKIDEKKILKSVDMSRKHVETVREATGLSVKDIVITQQSFLSPWHLAVYPYFLRNEVHHLPREERDRILGRVHYLLKNRAFGKKVLAHVRNSS